MKIEIYDPPMCCSSGLCGPSIDGQVFKTGEYPSYEELCKALGIEPLQKGKPLTMQFE